MFRIEMLPAGPGDCLWIEYGETDDTRIIMVDGGDKGGGEVLRKRIDRARKARGVDELEVELLVITHIDNDHIVGIVELLNSNAPVKFRDVWFNGRQHVATLLGTPQGDALGQLLARHDINWNKKFKGEPVMFDGNRPPTRKLPGEMKITVLGPTPERLENLGAIWLAVQEAFPALRADPGTMLGKTDKWPPKKKAITRKDDAEANGSSIVLLLEYGGHSVLLTGDAFHADLGAAINKLTKGQKLKLSALKVPHHGSKSNVGEELYSAIQCPRFLISTNGTRFFHPDHDAILRILEWGGANPQLLFNCTSKLNKNWGAKAKDVKINGEVKKYAARYPKDDTKGYVLNLS